MRAKDIMEPVRGHLLPDETIKDAVNKMRGTKRGHGLSVQGMIVFDNGGRPVGVLSIKDILRAIVPDYLTMAKLEDFTWDGMLEEICKKVAKKRVGDVMTKGVITVFEDAPLMEIADIIVKGDLQRVTVVNKEHRIVGIVYIRDLYNTIVKVLFEED